MPGLERSIRSAPELEDGAELYFQLIRNMSTSIKTCLTEAS
jgi:ABC-type Zn2+ transport system substrate-binding protein/surface adhesin